MPKVRFPNVMKFYLADQTEIFVEADSIQELVERVADQYPAVRPHLLDSSGNLRRHFNIFLNGTHIRELDGMNTKVVAEDKVILMASAAGGVEFFY